MDRYIFAKNVNDTGKTAIVDIYDKIVLCWCDENQSVIILQSLKQTDIKLKMFSKWLVNQPISINETLDGNKWRQNTIGGNFIEHDKLVNDFLNKSGENPK